MSGQDNQNCVLKMNGESVVIKNIGEVVDMDINEFKALMCSYNLGSLLSTRGLLLATFNEGNAVIKDIDQRLKLDSDCNKEELVDIAHRLQASLLCMRDKIQWLDSYIPTRYKVN